MKLLKSGIALFILLISFNLYALDVVKPDPGYYPSTDIGRPVANGYFYVGIKDLDPSILANQKQVTVRQESGVEVQIPQPIDLSAGGVPEYLDSPVTVLVDGVYSLKVFDSHDVQIYYIPESEVSISGLIGEDHNSDGSHIVYESIADLRASALTPFDGQVVKVTGYYVAGDGGGQYVYWVASSTASDNGIFIFKDTSETIGRWLSVDKNILNAKSAGATGDGVTDDTARLNAYENSFNDLYLPAGTYLVTSWVIGRSYINIRGDGQLATTITSETDAVATIQFTKSGTLIQKCSIKNLTISYTGSSDKTSGQSLDIVEGEDFVAEDLFIKDYWNGIRVLGGQNMYFERIFLSNSSRTLPANIGVSCLFYSAGTVSQIPTAIHFSVINVAARQVISPYAMEYGYFFDSSDSIYMDRCHASNGRVGMGVIPDDDAANFFIGLWVENSYFDNATLRCVDINSPVTGNIFQDIMFTGCEFRAGEQHVVKIDSEDTLAGVTFNGCHFRQGEIWSLNVGSTGAGSIEEVSVVGCTFKKVNTTDALTISDALYGAIVDGLIHNSNIHQGGEPTTGRCVTLVAGSDNLVVIGNNFGLSDNLTGVQDSSGSANIVIEHNLGP